MNVAFVCGNGVSRQFTSISELQKRGKVYACNAVFRTETPDYLIAVDARMVAEINATGYQHRNEVWTNRRKLSAKFKGFNFFNPSKGWSSGPTALWLASEHKYDAIYILGFDYAGLENNTKVNNIFAGTPNYKRKNTTATYYGNWLRQTCQVIEEHPEIQFIRVIQPENFCPRELNKFENYSTITVSDFSNTFNLSP